MHAVTFTEDMRAFVVANYHAMSYDALAARLGVSRGALATRIDDLLQGTGIKRRTRNQRPNSKWGFTYSEPEKVMQLIERYNSGVPMCDIADELGVPNWACSQSLRRWAQRRGVFMRCGGNPAQPARNAAILAEVDKGGRIYSDIAREFGVSPCVISGLVRRRRQNRAKRTNEATHQQNASARARSVGRAC